MLVALLNVPRSPADWAQWSFAHKQSHLAIASAIAARNSTQPPAEYQLDPIPENDVPGWLTRNQQAHNDMNGAIGAQSSDLQDIDLKDEKQRASWIYSHFLEHQTAEQALGV